MERSSTGEQGRLKRARGDTERAAMAEASEAEGKRGTDGDGEREGEGEVPTREVEAGMNAEAAGPSVMTKDVGGPAPSGSTGGRQCMLAVAQPGRAWGSCTRARLRVG